LGNDVRAIVTTGQMRFGYRFAFNGKEQDNEVSGSGNVYDYGFRIYNPRLGKFLSVDPLVSIFPSLTPYQFSANMPIAANDLDGLEAVIKINSITVSRAFLKIQTEEGTEAAVKMLNKFMEAKHIKGGMDWLGKITNGDVDQDVIVVGDKPGLPEKLVIYSLEMQDDGTAKFVQYTFDVPGEPEELSNWDRFKDAIGWPWMGEKPSRKTRRATWFEKWLDKHVDYDELNRISQILQKRSGESSLSPNTVDFSDDESGDNTSLKDDLDKASDEIQEDYGLPENKGDSVYKKYQVVDDDVNGDSIVIKRESKISKENANAPEVKRTREKKR
jgi:RHS repeat-associated protein